MDPEAPVAKPIEHLSHFAERLLERQPESSYVSMWEELLKREKSTAFTKQESSLILFRLGNEWLGLATIMVQEILEIRSVHTIPSTHSPVFLGIVNVRGQLRVCVSMHRLLEITEKSGDVPIYEHSIVGKKHPRMIAMRRGAEVWVFPVDEVYGVINCDYSALNNIPVNVFKSSANYFRGIWEWQKLSIAVIDDELLFQNMRRLMP